MQRVAKFVKYLPCHGFKSVVLTCDEPGASVTDSTLLSDIPEDTEIIRVPKKPGNLPRATERSRESIYRLSSNHNKLHPKRFLYPDEYALWAVNATKKGEDRLDQRDIGLIFSSFGSPSTLFLGYYFARKYSLPWVVDIRDFWSLNEMHFQYTRRKFPINFLDKFFDRFFMNRASSITVVSDYYREELIEKFRIEPEKVSVIHNGFDEDDFRKVEFAKDKKVFKIRYIGFLIREQKIEVFLKVLRECAAEFSHDFILEFVGGSNPEYIRGLIENFGLSENSRITGYQPHVEAIRMMMEADALLLIPGLGKGTITGKLFEYMRSGTPILMLDQGNRDAGEILARSGRGLVVGAGDKSGIKEALMALYSDWLKSTRQPNDYSVVKEFSRYELTGKLAHTFKKHIQ